MGNVKHPAVFLQKLIEANDALFQLLEACRESHLPGTGADGCLVNDEESEKHCFQVAGQFSRPGEFLAALLDMIRVTYEPTFFGSFFLNSNPAFIYDAIPKTHFRLGYLSVIGAPGDSFQKVWQEQVLVTMSQLGYDTAWLSSGFVVVGGSAKRMGYDVVDEVTMTLGSTFSTEEVMELLGAGVGLAGRPPMKTWYSGYIFDQGLDDRLRVSVWLFLEGGRHLRSV